MVHFIDVCIHIQVLLLKLTKEVDVSILNVRNDVWFGPSFPLDLQPSARLAVHLSSLKAIILWFSLLNENPAQSGTTIEYTVLVSFFFHKQELRVHEMTFP